MTPVREARLGVGRYPAGREAWPLFDHLPACLPEWALRADGGKRRLVAARLPAGSGVARRTRSPRHAPDRPADPVGGAVPGQRVGGRTLE